jgi:hypothetical protein
MSLPPKRGALSFATVATPYSITTTPTHTTSLYRRPTMARYQRKFTFISDPGHGWLKVPIKLLQQLGIAHKITAWSYQRASHAYLEEDCDMQLFVRAYEKRFGHKPEDGTYTHSNKSSKIRNYPYFDRNQYMPTQGE